MNSDLRARLAKHWTRIPPIDTELTWGEVDDVQIGCDDCAESKCNVCGHEPCPVCLDDCDDGSCLKESSEGSNKLVKTHECMFTPCERHRA